MNNRDLFDLLIERTTECKTIMPKRTLNKMLRVLEQFLTNWGWFDYKEDE
jgi:hypothetical protein